MPDPQPATQSGWKTFLDFLWDGGYRSTIVFSVTLGAIAITVGSDKFCRALPPELPQPVASMPSANPTPALQQPVSPGQKPSAPIQAAIQQPTVVVAQPNPICAKYFELAFMVVGGYLGLSIPKGARTPVQPSDSSNTNGEGETTDGVGSSPRGAQILPAKQTAQGSQTDPAELNESGSQVLGAVRTGPSPAEGVSGGGDARIQPADPDKPEPGLQQGSQPPPGFSRGGGVS